MSIDEYIKRIDEKNDAKSKSKTFKEQLIELTELAPKTKLNEEIDQIKEEMMRAANSGENFYRHNMPHDYDYTLKLVKHFRENEDLKVELLYNQPYCDSNFIEFSWKKEDT
jgi:hypothetical protein